LLVKAWQRPLIVGLSLWLGFFTWTGSAEWDGTVVSRQID